MLGREEELVEGEWREGWFLQLLVEINSTLALTLLRRLRAHTPEIDQQSRAIALYPISHAFDTRAYSRTHP